MICYNLSTSNLSCSASKRRAALQARQASQTKEEQEASTAMGTDGTRFSSRRPANLMVTALMRPILLWMHRLRSVMIQQVQQQSSTVSYGQ